MEHLLQKIYEHGHDISKVSKGAVMEKRVFSLFNHGFLLVETYSTAQKLGFDKLRLYVHLLLIM